MSLHNLEEIMNNNISPLQMGMLLFSFGVNDKESITEKLLACYLRHGNFGFGLSNFASTYKISIRPGDTVKINGLIFNI
jgi:hypothetical protein